MLRRSLTGAIAVALLFAAPASATEVLNTTLSEAQATERTCHAGLATGDGVARREVTVPAAGLVRARLAGPQAGNWDLAVFDSEGRTVAGSAHFGSHELAEGIVRKGQELIVQACRRSGSGDEARLSVENVALEPATGENRVQLARVFTPTRASRSRLVATGLDLTEHGGADYVDVVLHGTEDAETLATHGFGFEVLIDDLVAHDRAERENDTAVGQTPDMPSGQVGYRRLQDYSDDLQRLAREHPDLVRPITLPYPSLQGRPIQGVEITTNPDELRDGKPVFLQMGLHHAREWSSGEHAIEWAFELVNRYGKDERATRLVEQTRTIVIPVVNPDGFNLSREAPFANENFDPVASELGVDSGQPVVDAGFAYKRRNCRMVEVNSDGNAYQPRAGDCADTANRRYGVDPNRNYGGLWGGPGATHDPTSDTFYGEGPFSEPETRNIQALVSERQVTTLISNHTYSDLILRPPGVAAQGDTHDEAHYKSFADSMADQNGYSSWQSYQLYDTSGTTEDWSYYATGGFGFTFEIGRAAQSVTNDASTGDSTGDLALAVAGSYVGVGFHPAYPVGVMAEWHGKGAHAGKGNREAYYVAQEATLNAANHSVIEGDAAPGTVLTLSKTFQTATSPRGVNGAGLEVFDPEGTPRLFTDRLESQLVVPESGEFEWHVNPSTRPDVAKGRPGREPTGPTTADQEFAHDPSAPLVPAAGAPLPGSYEERDFSIATTEDNGRLDLHVEWPMGETLLGPDDLDVHLFRKNDLGLYEQVGSSTNAGGPEDIALVDPPPGDYRIRVENWYATNEDALNWVATLKFTPPSEGTPGTQEAWSLSCVTPNGKTATTSVVVDRGERVTPDLRRCGGKKGKPKKNG